jgi:Sec-independent protein translocase protein TatA
MKWLIILLILLIVVALVAARYRRQIMTAWQLWRMFKKMRQMSQPKEKRIETVSADKNEPLVRCERCGNWVPQSDALKLRSKTVYCSANCMERAVKLQSLVD